ncbi:arginine utilization protein RocB [Lachnospiraceae bacterium KM106-2]|nr:arginine utilization protein RocB [Lachnospiraceae bacterium KM106-2]
MIHDEMLSLAKQMIEIPSINTTNGEREIGVFIESYIRKIPYFQKHPDQVIVQELKDDPLHRRNVTAILLGEKGVSKDTLLFHGHTDTVGLEGYGALEEYACKPDELRRHMQTVELSHEVREDLESGDYLFGRGSCDMKSGDAVFLVTLKQWSEHPEQLSGNIVVSFNPVEENLHTGMIEGLTVLDELKERYSLNFLMGINNDFIAPLYPNDQKKTIYTGMVGKLLPCFYIQGKETHVGQCFEGFDASMVAAGLVHKIHLNKAFSDEYEGEYSYPPSVLKMKDLKPWYNVQTAAEAFVYFNYFVHNASMEEITDKLVTAAGEVFEETVEKINSEYQWFCEKSGQEYMEYHYKKRVVTYDELYQIAKEKPGFSNQKLAEIIQKELEKKTDTREVPIAMIRYLLQTAGITTPIIVVYYAAPYCPHNTLQGENEKLVNDLKKITAEVMDETGDEYRFLRFYPSLSDSSYLKIDDTKESVDVLKNNFPAFEHLYPVPLKLIQKINIPAVNFGCYGKDAHKWTERVNIPYTFGVLPKLIEKTITYYLEKGRD